MNIQLWLVGTVGRAKVGAEQEGQVRGLVWKGCQEGCVEKVQPHVGLGWKRGIGAVLTELGAVLWKVSALCWEGPDFPLSFFPA